MKTFFVTEMHFFLQVGMVVSQTIYDQDSEKDALDIDDFKEDGRTKLFDYFVAKITLDDEERVSELAVKHLMRDKKRVEEDWQQLAEFDFDCFPDEIHDLNDYERIYAARIREKLSHEASRVWVRYFHAELHMVERHGTGYMPNRRDWLTAWMDGQKATLNSREYDSFKLGTEYEFEKRSE